MEKYAMLIGTQTPETSPVTILVDLDRYCEGREDGTPPSPRDWFDRPDDFDKIKLIGVLNIDGNSEALLMLDTVYISD